SKAPYFQKTMAELGYSSELSNKNLSYINMQMIQTISFKLGLKTKFMKSSDLKVQGCKQEKIINLVQAVNGACYISGVGARKYQDSELFHAKGITLQYQDINSDLFSCKFNNSQTSIDISVLHFLFHHGFSKTGN